MAKRKRDTFETFWKKRRQSRLARLPGLVRAHRFDPKTYVVLFAIFGVVVILWAAASGNAVTVNPQLGKLSGNAKLVQNSTYLDGSALEFGDDTASTASASAAGSANTPAPASTPTPTPTPSCGPSGVCVPVGDISGWTQTFETNFPGTVPVGAFSGCSTDDDTEATAVCTGLQSYGSYYSDWWAYPSGWPDTSEECIEGTDSCSPMPPIGGTYQPEKVVSVSNNEMHIDEYRPASGTNVVATVVPRPCMFQEYGRYTERFEVAHADPGFKSAHLFYEGGYEIDYPEADYGSTIYAFTHPGGASFDSNAAWTTWHTTVIEWTPGSVKFYMDGTLIGTTTAQVPNIPMSWILQNESSIEGPYAAPGATAELNIAWVACYKLSS